MTKENLLEWGLTEEQANKVMEGLNGSFVTKSRFNEVNTELTNAKNTIKERDTQLETLKKSTGDTKALQDQITQLQTDNANQKKAHEAELKALKIGNAVDMALTGAKAPDKKFKGAKPGEKSDTPPAGDDPSKMTYDELCQYLEAHPDAKLD